MSLKSVLRGWNRRRLERRKFAKRNKEVPDYGAWVRRFSSPSAAWLADLAAPSQREGALLISVVMPVYNPELEHLEMAIESVLAQSHARWELCIADDASTDPRVRTLIAGFAARDSRIKFTFRSTNGHISEASNSALALATGEFVALLDQDDVLAPHALSMMAAEVASQPQAQLVYSDEDKLDDRGARGRPHFKPDWNLTLAWAHNYVCHLMMIRRSLVEQVGGFRRGVEGAQDHDLLLRCAERLAPNAIRHVPLILYHWRDHAKSTASSMDSKPYALVNGCRVVQEHLDRIGVRASVELDGHTYRVLFDPPGEWPLVSVIIPTRDKPDLLKRCVQSVLALTDYPSLEFVVVDNGTSDVEALALLRAMQSDARVRVIRDDRPFNYSALNNHAALMARGTVLCLMNNDIEVTNPGWLKEMVSVLLQPGVGVVGSRLLYPDGTIQHAGVIMGLGGTAGHIFRTQGRDSQHYMRRPQLMHELSAVTAACLVTRSSLYRELGGLDAQAFAVAFNDVDYCLRVREAGWKVIYDPRAELTHHESASRGKDKTREQKDLLERESLNLRERWQRYIDADPAYNANLSLNYEDAPLAANPRTAKWTGLTQP